MKVQFDEGFQPQDAAGQERELLPDGIHNVTIRKATDEGEQTTVVLAPNGHYRLVYVDYRNDLKGQATAARLAQALGMSAREWAACQPADLERRRLRIESRQYVANNGKTKVNVDKFLPPEPPDVAPPPAAEPVIRTQAAKVAAARGEEAGGEDDVPF